MGHDELELPLCVLLVPVSSGPYFRHGQSDLFSNFTGIDFGLGHLDYPAILLELFHPVAPEADVLPAMFQDIPEQGVGPATVGTDYFHQGLYRVNCSHRHFGQDLLPSCQIHWHFRHWWAFTEAGFLNRISGMEMIVSGMCPGYLIQPFFRPMATEFRKSE
jgi:hypothetical protein